MRTVPSLQSSVPFFRLHIRLCLGPSSLFIVWPSTRVAPRHLDSFCARLLFFSATAVIFGRRWSLAPCVTCTGPTLSLRHLCCLFRAWIPRVCVLTLLNFGTYPLSAIFLAPLRTPRGSPRVQPSINSAPLPLPHSSSKRTVVASSRAEYPPKVVTV